MAFSAKQDYLHFFVLAECGNPKRTGHSANFLSGFYEFHPASIHRYGNQGDRTPHLEAIYLPWDWGRSIAFPLHAVHFQPEGFSFDGLLCDNPAHYAGRVRSRVRKGERNNPTGIDQTLLSF